MPMVLSKDTRKIFLKPGRQVIDHGVVADVKQTVYVEFENQGGGFVTGLEMFRTKDGSRGRAKGVMDTAEAIAKVNETLAMNGEEPWTEEYLVERLKANVDHGVHFMVLDEDAADAQPDYIVKLGDKGFFCNLCSVSIKKSPHLHEVSKQHQGNLAEVAAGTAIAV